MYAAPSPGGRFKRRPMPLFRRRWLIACEMDLQNHPVFAPKDRRIPFGGRRRRKSGETLRTLRRWKKAEHHQNKKDARSGKADIGTENSGAEGMAQIRRAKRGRGEPSKKPVDGRQARGSRSWQSVPTRRARRQSRGKDSPYGGALFREGYPLARSWTDKPILFRN